MLLRKVAEGGALKRIAFNWTMAIARKRRLTLDNHEWPAAKLCVEWTGAEKFVLSGPRSFLGDRLRFSIQHKKGREEKRREEKRREEKRRKEKKIE